METIKKVRVNLGERSYFIEIGNGLLKDLAKKIRRIARGNQVVLLSNEVTYSLYGQELANRLEIEGYNVLLQTIPDGENFKSWEMAGQIIDEIAKARFNRDAMVLALGGGVIGDLGGFVASIYQRGIDFVQVPTTLLSQVDSSVGGKVAVNHPLGKNMIGAFYQPLGVFSDLDTLQTLPKREWIAGLAEVVKYGVIWDKDFFELLENNVEQIKGREQEIVQEIIRISCEIKAKVVAEDEREQGLRAILNYGHTIGHAIESTTKYKVYRHGEAISIGMVAAGKLAVALNMFKEMELKRIERLLVNLELPISLPKDISIKNMIDELSLDKKVRDEKLVFVLPQEIGKVKIVKDVERSIIEKMLKDWA